MVKSRAEIQRQYRERLKQDKEAYELYLLKARQRKHKNYVPVDKLSRKEKSDRRSKNKEYLQRHRLKRRLLQEESQRENAADIQNIHETSGYESASQSDTTPQRLLVNMPFPRRKAGARMRVTKALEKKNRDFKKLQDNYSKLKKKYNTKMRAMQRMKKKKQISRVTDDNPSSSMSPRTKTKYQIQESGLNPKQALKVRKQLLLGNTVLSEIKETRQLRLKNRTSICSTLSKRLLKKYRLIRRFSQNTGIDRKALTLASAMKQKRRREIEKNKESVIDFLSRDDNSRQNPGKKDKLKCNGEAQQTRTLNDYLKNLHKKYLSENPNVKLSLSSFTRIRPTYIKTTSFTSRSSCLCTKHQNMALCIKSLKVSGLDIPLNPETFINDKKHIETVKSEVPEKIKYGQWKRVSVEERGRTKMVTKIVECELAKDEFLKAFQKQVDEFDAHVNRVRRQYSEIKKLKEGLTPGDVLVHMDFAENYLCKSMDEVQSAYWSQTAVTLHPVVIYYKELSDNSLKHRSLVIISDEMGHNSTTVQCFIQHIIPEVKAIAPGVQTIHYWTDSPTSQYRNKSIFQTIANHKSLFGVKAVWNFFEAGHGKGPCDGLGGITKRLADEAVRAGKTIIQNALEFYEWTQGTSCTMTNVTFMFISSVECQNEAKRQKEIEPKAIKGTMKLHVVVGRSNNTVLVSELSCYCQSCLSGTYNCQQWRSEKLASAVVSVNQPSEIEPVEVYVPFENKIQHFDIGKYVAAIYGGKWYIGRIVQTDNEDEEIEVTFMKNCRELFQWPKHEDKI